LSRQPISKSSWSFTINSLQKNMLVDSVLPSNSIDGSTIRVTHDGLFDNVELKTGDIVTPYSNKTKLLLHRITPEAEPITVSNDVTTAGDNAVSGNALTSFVTSNTLKIENNKLEVKYKTNDINPTGISLHSDEYNGLSASLDSKVSICSI
ncbi:MAG: hypothetical protein RSB99_04340, partial [Bacilli bacterium]